MSALEKGTRWTRRRGQTDLTISDSFRIRLNSLMTASDRVTVGGDECQCKGFRLAWKSSIATPRGPRRSNGDGTRNPLTLSSDHALITVAVRSIASLNQLHSLRIGVSEPNSASLIQLHAL